MINVIKENIRKEKKTLTGISVGVIVATIAGALAGMAYKKGYYNMKFGNDIVKEDKITEKHEKEEGKKDMLISTTKEILKKTNNPQKKDNKITKEDLARVDELTKDPEEPAKQLVKAPPHEDEEPKLEENLSWIHKGANIKQKTSNIL